MLELHSSYIGCKADGKRAFGVEVESEEQVRGKLLTVEAGAVGSARPRQA
jgi:hypothetical protein